MLFSSSSVDLCAKLQVASSGCAPFVPLSILPPSLNQRGMGQGIVGFDDGSEILCRQRHDSRGLVAAVFPFSWCSCIILTCLASHSRLDHAGTA